MPRLKISIPHQLTRAEVKSRIQNQIVQARTQYGPYLQSVNEYWTEDTLDFRGTAAGVTVSGQMHVRDQEVLVEVDLPWFLLMLTGQVRQTIEQEGRKLLEHRCTA